MMGSNSLMVLQMSFLELRWVIVFDFFCRLQLSAVIGTVNVLFHIFHPSSGRILQNLRVDRIDHNTCFLSFFYHLPGLAMVLCVSN